MAEATDAQMQTFADQRIRPFAEALRSLFDRATDNQQAQTDCLARANGLVRWNDNRLDGPPHLLMAGNSANPDDVKIFKAVLAGLLKLKAGTFATLIDANAVAADITKLMDACVRPTGM